MIRTQLVRSAEKIDGHLRKQINLLCQGKANWPLFVHGPVGTGKTCAGLVLHDRAGGFFYSANEWAKKLIDADNGKLIEKVDQEYRKVSSQTLWRGMERARCVIIDELGARIDKLTGQASEHMYDSIKELVDIRYAKPLVLMSNLNLTQISKVFDDRLADRIAQGTIVELKGKSRRTGQ